MIGLPRRGDGDDRPIPAHPYRDTALVYGVMSVALVALATATGGSAVRAVVVACGFFVVATGWSWWRFRARIREREAAARAKAEAAAAAAQPPDIRVHVNGNGRGGAT